MREDIHAYFYSRVGLQEDQPYRYNGKEWVDAFGLDEYDSQARWYYPAIMRTTTMDPHAEEYPETSPYVLATAGIAIVGWAYGKLGEGFVDMYYNLNAQMNDKGFWANLGGYEYDGTRW